MNIGSWRLSTGQAVLGLLAAFGVLLILVRFALGLGAVTNLSDAYPWGLWIGFDVLAGIALAAGGFVIAGMVHLFGLKKYQALARPAILTAFLGYLLFIAGLTVDLGRPWNFWNVLYPWQHESPMFEVAWCVMMYTFVLFLEFLPSILEKFRLERLHAYWNSLVPWLIIFMLGLFTLAMTHSAAWALAMVAILLVWETMMRKGIMPRDKQMPILLIMAGVIFSTLHQSSLGSLFLVVPHKLHPLWYSPIQPILFFVSAVMVGTAMVTFEGLVSQSAVGRKAHFDLLADLARVIPYLLGFYLLLKVADLVGRDAAMEVFKLTPQAVSWWLELSVGVTLPLALFLTPGVVLSRRGLLWSVVPIAVGVMWNRLNVAVVGVIPLTRGWATYYPALSEILISVGLVGIGLIVFNLAAKHLPIYGAEAPSTA